MKRADRPHNPETTISNPAFPLSLFVDGECFLMSGHSPLIPCKLYFNPVINIRLGAVSLHKHITATP